MDKSILSTITITVVGIVTYAILDYRKNYIHKKKLEQQNLEEKDGSDNLELLETHYRATRNISIFVRQQLIAYAEQHNAYDKILSTGDTIKRCIDLLEKIENDELSEQRISDILAASLSSDEIRSLSKWVEEHNDALIILQMSLQRDGVVTEIKG
jgi:hypothetical protein